MTYAGKRLRVLMLATDAHGGFGGIAQYNRDILQGLSELVTINEVVVLTRIGSGNGEPLPPKVQYDSTSLPSLRSFIFAALRHALFGRRFDLIYCAHVNLTPLAVAVAALQRAPMLLAVYGIDVWNPPSSRLVRMAAGRARFVISISQITLDRFLAWQPYPVELTTVLPNAIHVQDYGIAPKDIALSDALGLSGRKVIMTFGRMSSLERYKGFDEVLEILPELARECPEIIFLAAGDGTDRARLEMKAKALGVADRTVFTGRIPEARKADHFRLADVYAMPSRGEGFGFVVLEAMACGIPVVASCADGTREAVRDGELGLLVDPEDSTALKAAILQSIDTAKAIPPGLEFFAFNRFTDRLGDTLRRWLPTKGAAR